jgi:hypothetical protein
MSEILGYLVLALAATAFVSKTAADIHASSAGSRVEPIVQFESGHLRFMDPIVRAQHVAARWRRRVRHFLCTIVNGGHELYRARTDTRLYQQCLLCGYETHGWTIDRRDRRLHLVSRKDAA